jgi:LmbE family N-acetylglucosaminyl deacetylase
VFAGQIDGDTIVNNDWLKKLQQLIKEEAPDIVFTHWSIDSHKDHQCASLLTIQTWMRAQQKFPLYFFEVCAGEQTMTFHPTDYVDISNTQEQKRKAVYCHTSQDPPGNLCLRSCSYGRISGKRAWCKSCRSLCKDEWEHARRFISIEQELFAGTCLKTYTTINSAQQHIVTIAQ